MTLAEEIYYQSKLSGCFTLRSGKTSDIYFDKYQFEAIPDLLLKIAYKMKRLIPSDTEILAGLEMGGIPLVTILSQLTGLNCAFIRTKPKEYGTCRYIEGAELINRNVLLIEDIVSSGGAVINSTKMLRNDGIIISEVLCVIDRETGGYDNLQKIGVKLISLYKQSAIENERI